MLVERYMALSRILILFMSLLNHIASPDSNAASVSVTYDTTGANLIVVFGCAENTLSGTSVADNQGNTYTDVGTEYSNSGKRIRCYYCYGPTNSSSLQITLTPGASGKLSVCSMCFSLAKSSPIPDTNGPIGAANVFVNSIQPASAFTPSVDNCIVVSACYYDTSFSSMSDGTFTVVDSATTSGGSVILAQAYVIQGTKTSVQPTWNLGGSPIYVGTMDVAFQANLPTPDSGRTVPRRSSRPGPYQPMGGGLRDPHRQYGLYERKAA